MHPTSKPTRRNCYNIANLNVPGKWKVTLAMDVRNLYNLTTWLDVYLSRWKTSSWPKQPLNVEQDFQFNFIYLSLQSCILNCKNLILWRTNDQRKLLWVAYEYEWTKTGTWPNNIFKCKRMVCFKKLTNFGWAVILPLSFWLLLTVTCKGKWEEIQNLKT